MRHGNRNSMYTSSASMVRGRNRIQWRRWVYAAAALQAMVFVAAVTYLIAW